MVRYWDGPSWILWAISAAAVLTGRARSARWSAWAAFVFLVLMLPLQHHQYNHDVLVVRGVWIATGVLRGSQQYGYPGHSLWPGRIGMSDLQVAFVLAALLVLTASLTRTGRAALPAAGGLATLLLGLRYFTLPGYFGPVEIGLAQAALMAFLAFIALRLLVAVAARTAGRTRLGSGHDRDFDPPSA